MAAAICAQTDFLSTNGIPEVTEVLFRGSQVGYYANCVLPRIAFLSLLLGTQLLLAEPLPGWAVPYLRHDTSAWESSSSTVVLYEEGRLKLLDQSGRYRFRERVAMRILRPSRDSRDERAFLRLSGDDQVVSLKGWTLLPNEEVVRLDSSKVAETSDFTDYLLYSDIRVQHFLPPVTCVGCIFIYEYEKEGVFLAPTWKWIFGGNGLGGPTLESVFELRLPPEGKARWQTYNSSDLLFEERENSMRWHAKTIGPFIQEPHMPAMLEVVPRLVVNFAAGNDPLFATWDDIAQWVWALFETNLVVTPAIQKQADELIAGVEDPIEQVTQIFDFVQQSIRYVAIEIGIGGYKPHSPEEVLKQQYGDCKDKATLLAALLSAAGFDASPVLIPTRDVTHINPDFPSLEFNHAILALQAKGDLVRRLQSYFAFSAEAGVLWLDPTAEMAPFGSLPGAVQGQLALVVDHDRGFLLDVPELDSAKNRSDRAFSARLSPQGALGATSIERSSGERSMQERYYYGNTPKAQVLAALERRFATHGSPSVTKLTVENLKPSDDELIVRYSVELSQYGRRIGSLLILPALPLARRGLSTLFGEERFHPIDFGLGLTEEDRIEVTLPPDWEPEGLSPIEIGSDFGSYQLTFKVNGSVLEVYRRFRLTQPFIPIDQVPTFRDFVGKVLVADKTQLVLRVTR